MVVHTSPPPPALAGFVAALWHCRTPPRPLGLERLLPDGTLALIINLHADVITTYDPRRTGLSTSHRGTLIAGARAEYSVIDTACQTEIMGVQFLPGGAFPFLRTPACELQDLDVDLASVWKSPVGELRDRLNAAPTIPAKFRVLARALLAAFDPNLAAHPAVAYALCAFRSPEQPTVAAVIDRTGFSARHFINRFTAEVGLTPKRFLRVQRLQRAAHRLHSEPAPAYADLALDCGYCDQAHFIHDFRAFSGLTPAAYRARRGPYINHVTIDR